MGFRSDDKFVIYPLYFDSSVSRRMGRRVSKRNAIDKPTIELIGKAANSLSLHPVLEKDFAHPVFHWKKNGRVLVDKKGSKEDILSQIANRF